MSGRRARQTLAPNVLRWARERAGLAPERVRDWESSGRISLAQADGMARHTRTPLGYLFLKTPPEEDLSIPDYRTFAGAVPVRPTPELLDTIHLMRRRQAWMRDELVEAGAEPLPFVGTSRGESSSDAVAEAIAGSVVHARRVGGDAARLDYRASLPSGPCGRIGGADRLQRHRREQHEPEAGQKRVPGLRSSVLYR